MLVLLLECGGSTPLWIIGCLDTGPRPREDLRIQTSKAVAAGPGAVVGRPGSGGPLERPAHGAAERYRGAFARDRQALGRAGPVCNPDRVAATFAGDGTAIPSLGYGGGVFQSINLHG